MVSHKGEGNSLWVNSEIGDEIDLGFDNYEAGMNNLSYPVP